MKIKYRSRFNPSTPALKILRQGRIIGCNETPQHAIERMVSFLISVEKKFNTPPKELKRLTEDFGELIDKKYIVMGTPIITNAGRYSKKPLSACTVVPLDLRKDLNLVKKIVNQSHEDAMGTGFNLDEVEDPVKVLNFLNRVAVESSESGKEDRPVGNMATISIRHPKVLDFIYRKIDADERGEEWKFNISINVDNDFMESAISGGTFKLVDGRILNARDILYKISEATYYCGDPGLIFIERVNKDNPLPSLGYYKATSPCAEVALLPGESCQFGYINLGMFVDRRKNSINFDILEKAVRIMTRILDNSLELSLDKYAHPENKKIMSLKRKIGIGVCGLADMLVSLGLPYDSLEARMLSREVMIFINYVSKKESYSLAKKRGSFGAMKIIKGNKYRDYPGFLEQKYGKIDTKIITPQMWRELSEKIRIERMLRNSSTVALPPTGRSSVIIDASPSIEPFFSLLDNSGNIKRSLMERLKQKHLLSRDIMRIIRRTGRISSMDAIPEEIRRIYKTALEISPYDHILMVKSIQEGVDDSISKTVNIPSDFRVDDIFDIYIRSYMLRLKSISVFRNQSRKKQPLRLSEVRMGKLLSKDSFLFH